MVFLKTGSETGEELVQIDTYNPPAGGPDSEHVHPNQESGAEVLSGSLRFRIRGKERSVNAGESITIPANTPHDFWNDGEEEAHSVQWFHPALNIDRFFETYFALAHDGKLNEKGFPSLWQMAVSIPYFGNEIRLTSPPWAVQRATFAVLAPIGRLLGYEAQYSYPRVKRKVTPLGGATQRNKLLLFSYGKMRWIGLVCRLSARETIPTLLLTKQALRVVRVGLSAEL